MPLIKIKPLIFCINMGTLFGARTDQDARKEGRWLRNLFALFIQKYWEDLKSFWSLEEFPGTETLCRHKLQIWDQDKMGSLGKKIKKKRRWLGGRTLSQQNTDGALSGCVPWVSSESHWSQWESFCCLQWDLEQTPCEENLIEFLSIDPFTSVAHLAFFS